MLYRPWARSQLRDFTRLQEQPTYSDASSILTVHAEQLAHRETSRRPLVQTKTLSRQADGTGQR